MNKFLLATLALVAVAAATPLGQFECKICTDIVEDSEHFLGKEGEKDEKKIEKYCDDLFKIKFLDELICHEFFDKELEKIIAHMEDPASEGKDAAELCGELHMCKK